jgi:hypothetical protein
MRNTSMGRSLAASAVWWPDADHRLNRTTCGHRKDPPQPRPLARPSRSPLLHHFWLDSAPLSVGAFHHCGSVPGLPGVVGVPYHPHLTHPTGRTRWIADGPPTRSSGGWPRRYRRLNGASAGSAGIAACPCSGRRCWQRYQERTAPGVFRLRSLIAGRLLREAQLNELWDWLEQGGEP